MKKNTTMSLVFFALVGLTIIAVTEVGFFEFCFAF